MAMTKEARLVIDQLSANLLDQWLGDGIENGGITNPQILRICTFSFDDSRHKGAVKFVFNLGKNFTRNEIGLGVLSIEGISERVNAIKIFPAVECREVNSGATVWKHSRLYGGGKAYPELGLEATQGVVFPIEMETKEMANLLSDNLAVMVAKLALEFQNITADRELVTGQPDGVKVTYDLGKKVNALDVQRWNVTSKQPANLWAGATSPKMRKAKGESVGDDLLEMVRKG